MALKTVLCPYFLWKPILPNFSAPQFSAEMQKSPGSVNPVSRLLLLPDVLSAPLSHRCAVERARPVNVTVLF